MGASLDKKVDTVYQNFLYNSCLFLFLRHGIQKIKEHILQVRLYFVLLKKPPSV